LLFGQKKAVAQWQWNDDVGLWVKKSFGGKAGGLDSLWQNYIPV